MVTYSTISKELNMEHEVERGTISIVRIVNPCLYWIRCSNCLSVADIQLFLKSSELIAVSDVKRGDKVVVRFFDGRLYRGVVQSPSSVKHRNNERLCYVVFLVDAMDSMLVELDQLFVTKCSTCLDDLSHQLHLVAIEFGKPVGNLESGYYLDEKSHNEFQRNLVLKVLNGVDSIDFLPKGKYESVTIGKMKLWGKDYNNHNLLRLLIQSDLAQYRKNFITELLMSGWMDCIIEELKATSEFISPPPLPQPPENVGLKNMPPPPAIMFDQQQALHLKEITNELGQENLLDRVVPNPRVESFDEMNERYRLASRYEAILMKNNPTSQEQKFEYTVINGSSVVGCFVDVETDNDTEQRRYPPTSSDDDYISSSHCAHSGTDLSSHESDLMNENTFFSESDSPDKNTNYITTDAKLSSGETTGLEKRTLHVKRNEVSEFENRGDVGFGRGRLFKKYLLTSGNYSTKIESNRDGTNAVRSLLPRHFDEPRSEGPFVHSLSSDADSCIDLVNGSLDVTNSSTEVYCDIIRMDENDVPSPVATRPSKSSPTAPLPEPSPVPMSDVQAGELSAEESVSSVPLSRSSSVSSTVNLPDLLPINKRRLRREEKLSNPEFDVDSQNSSSQGMSPCLHTPNSSFVHEKSFEVKPEHLLNCKPNQPSVDDIESDLKLPRSGLSVIGRGKVFGDRNNFQKARGVSSPDGTSKSFGSSLLNEPKADGINSDVSVPVKCFGRGLIFRKPLSSTVLPSQRPLVKVDGHSHPAVTTHSKTVAEKSTPFKARAETSTPSKSIAEKTTPFKTMADTSTPSENIAEKTTPFRTMAETSIPSKSIAEKTTPFKTMADTSTASKSIAEKTAPFKTMAETSIPSKSIAEKTTPSKRIPEKSTPLSSDIDDTETELDLSSVKGDSSSDNPPALQAKLEAAMLKMKIQVDEDDQDGTSSPSEAENCVQPQLLPKVDLSEFVIDNKNQEKASDGEEDAEVEEAVPPPPPYLSDCYPTTMSYALKSGAGLLHGETDIHPAAYLSNLEIDELIYRNARFSKIDVLTRPQYLGIPAVLKRRNVVFIGPNRTKKSSAILIPLLSLLMNETYYSTLRKGHGPRCVIVAPTSYRVRTLSRLCSLFCGSRLMTIMTHGGGLELERKNDLAAGCDILITTPRCWLRLLQYPTVTNLSRLCHLVLDRFDVLADLFPRELKQLSAKIEDLEKIRARKDGANKSLAVQMILNAEIWSSAIEDVVTKLLNKPIVVITSYLEAVLYARITAKLTLVKMDARFSKLLDLVRMHSSKKIVIVCATANEVTELRMACSAHYIPLVAHEKMARSLLAQVKPQWCSSKSPPMLICTDAVLLELGITDAHVLIHFSLPESKTSFSERFLVLRDHIPDRILNPKVNLPQCVVHVMFDEACEAPFPFMVDFFHRISAKIPIEMLQAVKDIERKKEERKTTAPFCEEILHLGSCYKASTCKSRHVVLPKLDSPTGQLASKGLIKVQIVHVLTPVKYSARILAHNPSLTGSDSWTTYKSQFVTLNLKLGSYYASSKNRRQHGRPKVGDLLAYQEELDTPFARARVTQITKRDDRQEPTQVEIFLVDEGILMKSLMHTLYELPEDLKQFPDQAVFIYLANLRPVDLDTTWSTAVKTMVRAKVHKSEVEDVANEDIIGKILFTIGRNCVVENLRWFRRMTYSQCFTLDLRQLLLISGCALDNPEYSTKLSELCASGGLEVGLHDDGQESTSGVNIVSKEDRPEPPSWAHLSHGEDLILVSVVVDHSPSLFYIKMKRFHKNLCELEKDLSAKLDKNKEKVKGLQIGDVCAVQNPHAYENEPPWNRGVVCGISGEEAEIFFADYGDRVKLPVQDVYTIPWKFVVKLPFQAIECKLAGPLPEDSSGNWSQDAIDAFHNLVSRDECWGEFYVKVMDYDVKGLMTGGRRYHVILVDVDGDAPTTVNKKFSDMGYGVQGSLDIDESDLLDAYAQVKAFESEQFAVDDEDDLVNEDWDCAPADGNANSPTLPTHDLLPEEAEKSGIRDLDLDEVDIEDIIAFARALDPEGVAMVEREILPKSSRVTPAKAIMWPDLEKNCERESPKLPSRLNEADHPLLVRCAPLKTPVIYWRQDSSTITIKYMVPCLQIYKIDVSLVSVSFCAIVNVESGTDEYWKRINLFGPVHETSVSEKLTATCLRITVFKRIQGYSWPRLTHLETKDLRIKVDPEDASFSHRDEEDLLDIHFERGYKKFKSRVKSERKLVNEEGRSGLVIEDEDDVDEEEEFLEPENDNYDPYDPLS